MFIRGLFVYHEKFSEFSVTATAMVQRTIFFVKESHLMESEPSLRRTTSSFLALMRRISFFFARNVC